MSIADIVVKGRHVDVSPRFREHVEDKLGRLERFHVVMSMIDVEVSKEGNPRLAERAFEVEITCRSKGPVIRAEAASADKYSAFDLAYGKLEEQLRRYADKLRYHRNRRNGSKASGTAASRNGLAAGELPNGQGPAHAAEFTAELAELGDTQFESLHANEVFAQGPVVVREKVHQSAPMSVEQAVTEMEMVDHDFYLFFDVDSGMPAVVYRRRGFDYGLLRVDTGSLIGASGNGSVEA